jgi:2-(1,2-epoxy-1,2-dihydrophenyl)acetyl-CoA isomerase
MTDVLVEQTDSVLTVTLNRPDSLNALTCASYTALDCAWQRAAHPSIRAVILTGAGRGFCSGQDMSSSDSDDPASDLRYVDSTIRGLRSLDKPTIAAVNGAAAGGGLAYALACDYRVAARNARFVPAFFNVALVPDLGCSWFLARLLGYPRALEWLLTGRRLDADEALRWGLVSEVVEPEQLMPRARALASDFAAAPTVAIAQTKRLLQRALTAGLDEQLEAEARAQVICGASADYAEALAAFRDKRTPKFSGN